jgi:hypothetical protein
LDGCSRGYANDSKSFSLDSTLKYFFSRNIKILSREPIASGGGSLFKRKPFTSLRSEWFWRLRFVRLAEILSEVKVYGINEFS